MTKRKHHSQAQWQQIIQQQADSGLNAPEFCRQGLSSYKRRRQLLWGFTLLSQPAAYSAGL